VPEETAEPFAAFLSAIACADRRSGPLSEAMMSARSPRLSRSADRGSHRRCESHALRCRAASCRRQSHASRTDRRGSCMERFRFIRPAHDRNRDRQCRSSLNARRDRRFMFRRRGENSSTALTATRPPCVRCRSNPADRSRWTTPRSPASAATTALRTCTSRRRHRQECSRSAQPRSSASPSSSP